METLAVIIGALGLIPVVYFIIKKIKKPYKFDFDYKNITFSLFSDPQTPKFDKRFCLIIYFLRIVNNSEESKTLKNILISYRYNNKIYKNESHVIQTGIIPQNNEPAIISSNGIDVIFLMRWHNIRSKLGKNEILHPGGVFSGSAVFLFEPNVNLEKIKELKLIVIDFTGNKLSYPLEIKDEWFKPINKGFAVINKTFSINPDNSIQ
jgi:hypothetical protein